MCSTCTNRHCHVQLAGNSFKNISGEVLKKYLVECSLVKPLHVIKKEANHFALVYFATEIDAATFYYIYCVQKKVVCIRIEDVIVNPSLIGNKPVTYSKFQIQPRIISSTKVLCRCRCDPSEIIPTNANTITNTNTNIITTTNANVSDDVLDTNTTTANVSDDVLDTNTTTANISNDVLDTSTTTANISDNVLDVECDDEFDVGIENTKLKLTQTLKRKVKEMEKLSEEISKLQKKLRYLEEFQNL